MTTDTQEEKIVDVPDELKELFEVGAHYGYAKSRRHPSTAKFVFGVKNTVEIFDLEKTRTQLDAARAFVAELGKASKQLLFVSGKSEARAALVEGAQKIKMPYVAGRFIGGTLTNFDEIRKRVDRLQKLREQKEKGTLDKYTKHERLLMEREMKELDATFGGLVLLEKKPAALFVIDPRQESIAVREAQKLSLPIVALASSDCDISGIAYPIPANDASVHSIAYFVDQIVAAYADGTRGT